MIAFIITYNSDKGGGVVVESDTVGRSTLLKNVSVVFSESKFGSPYQNFLDPPLHCSPCQILVLFFPPKGGGTCVNYEFCRSLSQTTQRRNWPLLLWNLQKQTIVPTQRWVLIPSSVHWVLQPWVVDFGSCGAWVLWWWYDGVCFAGWHLINFVVGNQGACFLILSISYFTPANRNQDFHEYLVPCSQGGERWLWEQGWNIAHFVLCVVTCTCSCLILLCLICRLIIKILLCPVTNPSINHKKEYTHGVQATKRFSKCSATRKIPITVTEMRTF